jgi:thiosulfate dehydrogenase
MTRNPVAPSIPAAAVLVLAAIGFIGYMPSSSAAAPLTGATPEQPPAQKMEAARPSYTPPAENDIPDGPFGDMIRLGEAIFHDTQNNAKGFVGNDLQCSNCHLDRGRQPNAMPLGAAYLLYPAYRAKNGHVNTFQDYDRGAKAYAQHCSSCHGADGAGQKLADGQTMFPPLWGPRSFNWGAGMASINNAAEFIKANMPLGLGGSLSDQEAWDIATYMDSQERPQDPRFVDSVAETRKRFHDEPTSKYGLVVNGVLLGEKSPPSGTINAAD